MRQQVFELDQYQYGEWDKDLHMILFFQVKNNRPIYYNSSGMIAIYLNDKNEAVAYAQSMLDKPESNKDKKTLIKPIEAVGKLYDNNQLISGDEVSQIRIGYHTVVPLTNGVQVFVPTWKVTVNDKRSYFVNAIEGAVISNDDNDFLKEIVQFTDNKLSQISDDKSMRKDLHKMLLDKLKLLNGGEEQ
ncbi:two-component system regulatory protein YycI [Virgibacillus sp. 179-BFC.A HS]|uniref:Two-component system regulatory protein YycI n=1 Tax=Tigheibacillus jepli TaxID=3035914 RepID=A0ABU5CCZ8_9BACI|nr:two-component system regulatory protein YycI [Virgibacillus sp. 179-BFC.A HS]MDY0404146.1 two-component system regulatory protein YycI [Virgibacillus sp. 179-BFC.A HS]